MCAGVRPEMAAFDRIMGGPNQLSDYLEPGGDEEEVKAQFDAEEWRPVIATCRNLVNGGGH